MNKLLALCLTLLMGVNAMAKDIPAQPVPPRLVNDYAGVMSADEVADLESKLVAYNDSTSTQIVVVTEKTLDGDDLFDYCQRLAVSWGIGIKGKNNGLLIYVAVDDHHVHIHTGYGMEATITDALTKRIIEDHFKPYFKQGNYYAGLDEGIAIIMKAASGEFVGDGGQPKKKGPSIWTILLIIAVVLFWLFRGGRGGGRGRGGFGYGAAPFLGTFGSGGFSGGGSSFGGGGFGGFGGGGFGGGGSSGSW